jgi:hypothetical protein
MPIELQHRKRRVLRTELRDVFRNLSLVVIQQSANPSKQNFRLLQRWGDHQLPRGWSAQDSVQNIHRASLRFAPPPPAGQCPGLCFGQEKLPLTRMRLPDRRDPLQKFFHNL